MAKIWQAGAAGTLYHVYMKFNSDFGSVTGKLHILAADRATARSKATILAMRWRWIIPSNVDLVHCHISKDDSEQDSQQLPGVVGPGLFGSNKVGGAEITKYNRYTDHLCVTCEDETGGSVTRKFGPLPDEVVASQVLKFPVTAISGVAPPAEPATAAGIVYVADVSWYTEMQNFLQSVAANCVNVKSGHPPGGAFQYAAIWSMLPGVVGGKKGGRVLNSPHG